MATGHRWRLWIAMVIIASACGGQPVPPVFPDAVNEYLGVSVLVVNLQGVQEAYADHTFSWQDRYRRIADWFQLNRAVPGRQPPELIALQEVHGASEQVFSYETLVTLLTSLEQQTGVAYRIAYLEVGPIPHGVYTLWSGRALLYDPKRVTHLAESATVLAFDDPSFGVHLRQSVPCDKPRPEHRELCSRIDGNGRAWTAAGALDGRWSPGPVLARFELARAPGSSIHIYNVHEPVESKREHLALFDDLVAIERRFADRLYPPLVVGDFNRDVRQVLEAYPDFDIAGYANRDVMGVLVGKPDKFPAKQTAYGRTLVLPVDVKDPSTRDPSLPHGYASSCGDVAALWSDHCGVLIRITPARGPAPVLPQGVTATGNTMRSGQILHAGESIRSTSGEYELVCQSDSNLVLYRGADRQVHWKSDSEGRPASLCRLHEGKLVVYDADGNQMWASSVSPDTGQDSWLVVGDDGVVVIYRAGDVAVWRSS